MQEFDQASLVRQSIILLTPLTLGILEIWHPVGVGDRSAFESIVPKADWWLTLQFVTITIVRIVSLISCFDAEKTARLGSDDRSYRNGIFCRFLYRSRFDYGYS